MRAAVVTCLLLGGCHGPAAGPATPGAAAVEAEASEPDPGPPDVSGIDVVCGTGSADAARLFSQGVAAFEERGDPVEAERAYRAALVFDPRYCDAMDNLAVVLRRAGRLDEAVALYQRSLGMEPANQFAWQNLGVAYLKQGRLADADRCYQQLIALADANPEGWFGRGQVAYLDDRFADAIAALEQARARYLARGDAALRADAELLLGLAAAGAGDHARVRTYLDPHAARVADRPDANLALGAAFLDADGRDLAKARRYLTAARALGAAVPPAQWAAVAP
ncbi:MAG: tetratricopeptide repeat protein [Kofleriaceae bacterium]